jgi:hypothetical protein
MDENPFDGMEVIPHVMVDGKWIPVNKTDFIGIEEDLFGEDVYEFSYNNKIYTSHVIMRHV